MDCVGHRFPRVVCNVQKEVNQVCRCAAKWDAMPMNYSETWDSKKRETKSFVKRTKAIQFLFAVREEKERERERGSDREGCHV